MKQLGLARLVDDLTTSMLGMPATEVGVVDAAEDGRDVIGCVQLSAAPWTGSVLVSMSLDAAVAATAAMFMLPDDDVDEDLVADAVGEVANVLAGQVKAEMGGGCTMSLPTVTSGAGLRFAVPGTTVVDRRSFACGVGTLTVATLEKP